MINLTDKQLRIILDAVEDYAVLTDEDTADDCGEILDIIEAYLMIQTGSISALESTAVDPMGIGK
jgi:hypothetical protein